MKQILIKYPVTDLSLRIGTLVYRVKKSNVEIKIALFIEFTFVYCVDDRLTVLNWPKCFNSTIVLSFEDWFNTTITTLGNGFIEPLGGEL